MIAPLRNPKWAGFTLLEILIVLAISSALLVLVAPSLYRTISGSELPKATRQLATALQYSGSQAINLSKPVSLLLNVDLRSYQLSSKAKVHSLPQSIDLTLLTGTTLLEGEGEGAIVFYPDGSSSGGRITLSQGERRQQIDINWLTGEAVVSEDI